MSNPEERLVEINHLKKYFHVNKGLLHAVDDVSFYINKGETLGLVGESGCGKSTTGRTIIRLLEADSGEVNFHGENVLGFNKSQMKTFREHVQMVFQDPYSCLNPRLSVFELIAEPLTNMEEYRRDKKKLDARVRELMDVVGLSRRLINAYPHELDGGRRQRVGIARALSVKPEFIVLDEPVSALDVCIQAQIINLLKRLQMDLGLTYLFISHDLSVVKHISNRIGVMYLGKIVELSDYRSIFSGPLHPYTKALLSAIPIPKVGVEREQIILKGDVPSPVNLPGGCRFAGRCPYVTERCRQEDPELKTQETTTLWPVIWRGKCNGNSRTICMYERKGEKDYEKSEKGGRHPAGTHTGCILSDRLRRQFFQGSGGKGYPDSGYYRRSANIGPACVIHLKQCKQLKSCLRDPGEI